MSGPLKAGVPALAPAVPSTLHVHADDPLCAGPDSGPLVEQYVTPIDLLYVRNHGPVPTINEADYRLIVDGLVGQELSISLDEIKTRFPKRSVTATLQCAGNRREELHRVKAYQNEVLWSGDAIGTAVWTGVRLADVLRAAKPEAKVTHVWFEGLDQARVAGSTTSFGASIDLARANEPNVLLGYRMNGEPLPALHGAPLRAVVPGVIGARSVKWLGRVTLAVGESENHFQRRSYRMTTSGSTDGDMAIVDAPLNSYICAPLGNSVVAAGTVRIVGYATAAGMSELKAVELGIDGGLWSPAELLDRPVQGAWSRWTADVDLEPGVHEVRVRARDTSGTSQPDGLEQAWSPRGYLNNAVHTVNLRVGPPA